MSSEAQRSGRTGHQRSRQRGLSHFYLRGDHTRMVAQRFSIFFRGCKQPNLSSFVISAAKLRVICDLGKGFEIYKF